MSNQARFWQKEREALRCTLCPNRCLIQPGKAGLCGVRQNKGGQLVLPYFGEVTALQIDPIQKKPLYHFLEDTQTLSLGFTGCNLGCFFCQNWMIAQELRQGDFLSSKEVVQKALEYDLPSVAFTYSEPTIHFEYILETSKACHQEGIKTILVTNGYLNPQPAAELLPWIDAANVDLKYFSQESYSKHSRGQLKPVLEFLALASTHCHLEVTTLVIPGINDSQEEIQQICSFLATLDRGIPLHLSAYHPAYHSSIKATPPDVIRNLARLASYTLDRVHTGNI